jgi:hypothetical protein
MESKTRRRWLTGVTIAVALLAALWFSFDSIATWQVRKAMDRLTGYQVSFSDVELEPFKVAVTIHQLKVVKETAGGLTQPVFASDRVRAGLAPRRLLQGHLVGAAQIEHPVLFLIAARDKADRQLEPETPNLAQVLEEIMPLKVDRVQVKNGDVTFIDKTVPELPRIRLTEIDATLESLATRAALSQGEPTTVALSAKLQRSGRLTVFFTADPVAQGLYFAGRAELKGLELRELREVLAAETGLKPKQGTLDLYAEITAENGKLRGGIKPLLKNAAVEAGKDNLGDHLKAALADAALDLMSDDIKGRETVATIIPIHGNVKNPKAQLWPTVLGVVRNAFVLGVNEGFAALPPAQAKHGESVVTQAVKALNPKEGPPNAQPEEKSKGKGAGKKTGRKTAQDAKGEQR